MAVQYGLTLAVLMNTIPLATAKPVVSHGETGTDRDTNTGDSILMWGMGMTIIQYQCIK